VVQRDYILRMIEQMGVGWAALLRVAGFRQAQRYAQAEQLLDQTLRRSLGLDGGALDRLSAEELIGLVRLARSAGARDEVTSEKLLLLAALARERAALHAAQPEPERERSADYAMKALQIFLTVLLEEDPDAERASAAIGPLTEQLAGYALPPTVKDLLWQYHEQIGAFAKAEDWLFALLDEEPQSLARGVAFYERLARHPDELLARGDLPRDEVATGLAELRARAA